MHTSLSRSHRPVHQYKFNWWGSREPCRMRNGQGMWVNFSWLSWLCFELDQVDWIIWGCLAGEGQVGTSFEDLQCCFICVSDVSYAYVKKGHKICVLVFFKCLADHLWHSQTMQNLAAAENISVTTLPLPLVTVTPVVWSHVLKTCTCDIQSWVWMCVCLFLFFYFGSFRYI